MIAKDIFYFSYFRDYLYGYFYQLSSFYPKNQDVQSNQHILTTLDYASSEEHSVYYFFAHLSRFFMSKIVHKSDLRDNIGCIFFRDDLVGWMTLEHRLKNPSKYYQSEIYRLKDLLQ